MATKGAIWLLMVAALTSCAAPVPSVGPVESHRPPREPSDRIKDTSWVVGTVTTGGSGPCYSLRTDDGTRYALHSTDGTELVKGVRMRIRTERARVRGNCGEGKPVEMTAAEPLR